jgi:hypothetical protein
LSWRFLFDRPATSGENEFDTDGGDDLDQSCPGACSVSDEALFEIVVVSR